MIVLGIPVMNQHRLTQECLERIIAATSRNGNVRIALIDNASDTPIPPLSSLPVPVDIIRNEKNRGCFYPLKQLYDAYPQADYIGIMHNDVFMYQVNWDKKIEEAFVNNESVGMLGAAGSDQADVAGGRGTGTMHNFLGKLGQPQGTSRKVQGLHPAVLLDSLFMMFRRNVIPRLKISDDILLYHFYDKIWSMRVIEAGYNVAVLGLALDHIGGMTATADEKYKEDAKLFCLEHRIPLIEDDAEKTLYYEGERRLLSEYRDKKSYIPCRIDDEWIMQSG